MDATKKEWLWGKKDERRKTERRRKEERKCNEEGRRWYGLTSMGQDTETIKSVLRRERFNISRKGGEKLEKQVKK